jgi:NTE family protein
MKRFVSPLIFCAFLAILSGCATRPVNQPIAAVNLDQGYRYKNSAQYLKEQVPETLVILAFSGGGTRAAAFSYGVLETLRDIQFTNRNGVRVRALDEVDLITGVSGGSFTALAYGLYGDKLFETYESDFLKRDVQGEIVSRVINPLNWIDLSSTGWGRSELAAQYYDEILFHGATFEDLQKSHGPFILTTATDISTGAGFAFSQLFFDNLCSTLSPINLSRAASASSAVPFVLSPVTMNNYGGSCAFKRPGYIDPFVNEATAPRPAARLIKQMQEMDYYHDGKDNPYIHLVDGGVSDNLGIRGVLESLEGLEAMRLAGKPTPLDYVRRIIVVVVNSLSSPKANWNKSEDGPGSIELLLKATGVPIDHYSYEEIESLKDTEARWRSMSTLRNSALFAHNKNQQLEKIVNTPDINLSVIDVSFKKLEDHEEYEYLNNLPTSFSLPPEAVDRLRAAAKKIVLGSPDFQKVIRESAVHDVKY